MSKKRVVNKKLQKRYRPNSITPLTQAQDNLLNSIQNNEIIFADGSAGTGKTFISLMRGCEMLYDGDVSTLILTRPNVETAKSLGALPGELHEKLDPYLAVMTKMITSRFGHGWFSTNLRNGNIQLPALGFSQGATYDNSYIVIDEAEHLSVREMYIILTRIGEHSKMVLCGDTIQKFTGGENGFLDAVQRLKGVQGFAHVRFDSEDIVRSGICRDIVRRYS